MNFLKRIWLACGQLVKQAGLLPQTIAQAMRQRQQRTILNELEVERLDRIRHPEKYRGK